MLCGVHTAFNQGVVLLLQDLIVVIVVPFNKVLSVGNAQLHSSISEGKHGGLSRP